jgi:predicted metalloprotease with PDZ domain
MLAERVPVSRGPAYLERLLGLSVSDRGRGVAIDRVEPGSVADEVGLVPGLKLLGFGDVKPAKATDVHHEIFRHLGRRQVWLVVSDGRQAFRVKLRFQES